MNIDDSYKKSDGTNDNNDDFYTTDDKQQEIINSKVFKKNYKHHPESYYTSRSLSELIEQAKKKDVFNK